MVLRALYPRSRMMLLSVVLVVRSGHSYQLQGLACLLHLQERLQVLPGFTEERLPVMPYRSPGLNADTNLSTATRAPILMPASPLLSHPLTIDPGLTVHVLPKPNIPVPTSPKARQRSHSPSLTQPTPCTSDTNIGSRSTTKSPP